MTDETSIDALFDATVYDADGNKIGAVNQIYTDDQTQDPTWVSVNTGFFGTHETLIPLADARISGEAINVPYTKEFIKSVPQIDAENHLDADDERRLAEHYHAERYGVPNADPKEAQQIAAAEAVRASDAADDVPATEGSR